MGTMISIFDQLQCRKAERVKAYLRREFQYIRFDSTQDVWSDHIMQLLDEALVKDCKPLFQILQVPVISKSTISMRVSAYLNVSPSRKLRRLNNSRRLLLSGVPVNSILCTLLSCLRRVKIKLESDFTACQLLKQGSEGQLTSLTLVHADHFPSWNTAEDAEIGAGDHVVRSQNDMSACQFRQVISMNNLRFKAFCFALHPFVIQLVLHDNFSGCDIS